MGLSIDQSWIADVQPVPPEQQSVARAVVERLVTDPYEQLLTLQALGLDLDKNADDLEEEVS
ncbi:hypothetical protein [Streptomyces sp. N35]|uniref:hypothetical protein n=1 Tax=Streptomyces sp. N35 TaxID=2795730 RepID=UPI0018F3C471|nr:hypothetical protein [Streptomyces sp. N35]